MGYQPPNGGPDYDWYSEQLQVFNRLAAAAAEAGGYPFTPLPDFPRDCASFLNRVKEQQVQADLSGTGGAVAPPEVPLRHASESQKIVVALAVVRMLARVSGEPLPQLRLTLTGAAGSGKSFLSRRRCRASQCV